MIELISGSADYKEEYDRLKVRRCLCSMRIGNGTPSPPVRPVSACPSITGSFMDRGRKFDLHFADKEGCEQRAEKSLGRPGGETEVPKDAEGVR